MSSAEVPVITLDGPSGSGKGTVGQFCAQRLGWHYLDSGAIYRAVAVSLLQSGAGPEDVEAAVRIAATTNIECRPNPPDSAIILVDGRDVGSELRTERTGELASQLAAIPEVRKALLALQRRARREPGLVADGRDMGTVVFPDATLKIFLTASAEVRARRRYNQLKLKGFDVNLSHLSQAIQDRDARDSQRDESPLVPAEDAFVLDTSDLVIDEVVSRILDLLTTKLAAERAGKCGR